MKRTIRYAAALIALCLAVVSAAPPARAAGTGDTIHLADTGDLRQAVANAKDGDTIVLDGWGVVDCPESDDAPWVIDKAVTIQGGQMTVHAGGVILTKDVTIRGTVLAFSTYVRNAIMANGHTLTLEDVTCESGARSVDLFCGGLYEPDGFGSTPGPEGKLVIRGKTSLKGDSEPGSLYAGNLCMGGMNAATSTVNGPANAFEGSASIFIETDDGVLGGIYAGGAQRKIPTGAISGKVTLPDPSKYTVKGTVRVRLQNGAVRYVDGRGAGAVDVTYTGDENLTDYLTLGHISSLTVESGYVAPELGSSLREGAAVSVRDGGTLGMAGFGDVSVSSFTGGGRMVLDLGQTLSVTGAVTGTTTVGIGGFSYSGGSSNLTVKGHVYIRAPQAAEGAFRLAPPNSHPDLAFVWENGEWTGPEISDLVLVESVRFREEQTAVDSGEQFVYLPVEAVYAADSADISDLNYIFLTIRVNGVPAVQDEEGYYNCAVGTGGLSMAIVYGDDGGDELEIAAADFGAIPDGTYAIEIEVPGSNTASGGSLKASAKLIVGEGSPDPGPAYKIDRVSVKDGSVVCTVGAADGTAVLAAAAYTADGRLLRVGTAAVPGPGDVRVQMDVSGADHVKAFLLDSLSGMRPLCESVRQGV